MALASLASLDHHAVTPFGSNYPSNHRVFFAPLDDVHGALVDIIASATTSLYVAMYAFDDPVLATALLSKLRDAKVDVQITLDASQAGGVVESALLRKEQYPASSVAIGHSEKGAIIHLKACVVDGTDVVGGSTNWSSSGEKIQDNELHVLRDPVVAARYADRLDSLHTFVLAHPITPQRRGLIGLMDRVFGR